MPVKVLKYEDLHEDLHKNAVAMVRFLGADPAKLPKIPAHLLPGHSEEKPNSFNRKGVVGDWKNYINPTVAAWIHDEAGDELMRQGYVDSSDWIENDTTEFESQSQPVQVPAARKAA